MCAVKTHTLIALVRICAYIPTHIRLNMFIHTYSTWEYMQYKHIYLHMYVHTRLQYVCMNVCSKDAYSNSPCAYVQYMRWYKIPTFNSIYKPTYIRLIYSYTPTVHEMVCNTSIHTNTYMFTHIYSVYAWMYATEVHTITALERMCVCTYLHTYMHETHIFIHTYRTCDGTGWRRLTGILKLQVISAKEPLIIGLFCGKHN